MGYGMGDMLASYFYISAFPGLSMAMGNLVHICALLGDKKYNPWFILQSSVGLRILPNKEDHLYNKGCEVIRFNIPYIEEQEDLVKATHESRPSGKH
jgi:hypothetical protein